MDPVSFSDDTDDTFMSQGLRETLGQVSRRLELEDSDFSGGEEEEVTTPTQNPVPSSPILSQRGVPDGQTASIRRSTYSVSNFGSYSKGTAKKKPPLPRFYSAASYRDSDYATEAKENPFPPTNGSTNTPVEPIDLTNGPIDLRKNSQIDKPYTARSSPDTNTSKNSADSFDSVTLFPNREAVVASRANSYKPAIPANFSSYDDVLDRVTSWHDLANLNLTFTDDATYTMHGTDNNEENESTIEYPRTPSGTFQNGIDHNHSSGDTTLFKTNVNNPNKPCDIDSAVSKVITSTVKDIVTSYDSLPSTPSGSLNQTYDVLPSFILSTSVDDDDTTGQIEIDGASPPIEVESDVTQINRGRPASCFAMLDESSHTSLIENRLDGPNNNTSNDNTWCVKETDSTALSGQSLRFTFMRTPPSNLFIPQNRQPQYQTLDAWPVVLGTDYDPDFSVDSVDERRSVVGSNSFSEESTICSESSLIVPSDNIMGRTAVPLPATPDITLAQPLANLPASPLTMFPVSHVGITSTPTNTPIKRRHGDAFKANNQGAETTDTDSPRKRLLKQRAIDCQGSDSVLNIGFRDQPDESKQVKKKKKPKRGVFKRLNVWPFGSCTKLSAADTTSFNEELDTSTAKVQNGCLPTEQGRVAPTSRSTKQQILSKLNSCSIKLSGCTRKLDDTCPTTLFATLNDTSTGLTTWCQYIKDVTRATPQHTATLSTMVNQGRANTATVTGVYNSPKPSQDTKNQRANDTNARHGSLTSYSHFRLQSAPTSSPQYSPDGCFKKPIAFAPSKKMRSSKSAPVLPSSPSHKKPGKYRTEGDVPLLSSTPMKSEISSEPRSSSNVYIKPSSSSNGTSTSQTRPAPILIRDPESPIVDFNPGVDLRLSPATISKLSPGTDLRLYLFSLVTRETAEWLAYFVLNNEKKILTTKCDIQPNKKILIDLCLRCKIHLRMPDKDSTLFKLKKSKESHAPDEADINHLMRCYRRKSESFYRK